MLLLLLSDVLCDAMHVRNARCDDVGSVSFVDFTERSIGSFCTNRLYGGLRLSEDDGDDGDNIGILYDRISLPEVSKNADK